MIKASVALARDQVMSDLMEKLDDDEIVPKEFIGSCEEPFLCKSHSDDAPEVSHPLGEVD